MKRYIPLLILSLLVFGPFAVSAQTDDSDLEMQIRTALQAQAEVEGLSSDEFDELVSAMVAKAANEGLDAQIIENAFAPVQTEEYSESENYEYDEVLTDGSLQYPEAPGVVPVVVGALVFLVLLFVLWKKMEHGGAVGGVER